MATFRSATAGLSIFAGASTVGLPSGIQEGDYLVVFYMQLDTFNEGIGLSFPPGWVMLGASAPQATGVTHWWKLADAGDVSTGSIVVTLPTGQFVDQWCVGAFENGATGNFLYRNGYGSLEGNTWTADPVTVVGSNAQLATFVWHAGFGDPDPTQIERSANRDFTAVFLCTDVGSPSIGSTGTRGGVMNEAYASLNFVIENAGAPPVVDDANVIFFGTNF